MGIYLSQGQRVCSGSGGAWERDPFVGINYDKNNMDKPHSCVIEKSR